MRNSILLGVFALAAGSAAATDVNVIGLFPGKAVVVVNRGAPRTLAAGEKTPEGVLLLSADASGALLEFDGRREKVAMGQHFETADQTAARITTTLAPDAQGHFLVDGQVNGAHVRFLVDTGATYVSLPASMARRMGVDLSRARRGQSMTANGPVAVYQVMLETVTVGDVTLRNVEGVVHETPGLDVALLGMSFLNRTEMRRDGETMVLTKRF